MGDVTTAKETTAPSNPDVNPTVSKLLKGVQGAYDSGVKVYDNTLYPGAGGTTQNAWAQGANNANSLLSTGGFNSQQTGAMSTLGGLQSGYAGLSGAYDQDAPGYSTLRSNLMDDAVRNVGAGFNASGRFGGGSYVDQATKSAVDAVAPLDYQNFNNSIANKYRSLDSQAGIGNTMFGMGQQGIANRADSIAALGGIGAAQDADALASRQADNDWFRRKSDAPWQALERASGILHGTAGSAGTDTTKSIPWWQAALGTGTAIGSMFL